MNKLRLFAVMLTAVLFVTGCSEIYKEPEFKTIKNVKVNSKTLKTINFDFIAEMHNPNIIGITMTKMDLDLFYGDVKLADVIQNETTTIGANTDFDVPLNTNINSSDLFKRKTGLLGIALDALNNKKIDVQVKGIATFSIADLEFDVPVDDVCVLEL